MPPFLIFALGALVGAGATLLAPGVSRNGRPMLKEALKTAMLLAREAQVRGAELVELAEDLFAEAKTEAAASKTAEVERPVPRARRAAPTKRKRATARKAAAKASARTSSRRGAKAAAHEAAAPAEHA